MPYPGPQNWEDLPSTDTPITAARLDYMERGIDCGPYGWGISKWGLLAASIHPLAVRGTTGYGGAISLARTLIPAGVAISSVCAYVSTAGSGNAGSGPNGYGVYSISGNTATLVRSTANDTSLWTSTGWRPKALPSPIAAQSSDREVMLGIAISIATAPGIGATIIGASSAVNRSATGDDLQLSYYISGQTSWPSTVNLASQSIEDFGFICLGVF